MKPVTHQLDVDQITLIPISCIHYPVGDKGLLAKAVNRLKEEDAYTILLGDMLDQDRTTRRKHRKAYVSDHNSVESHDDRHNRRDVEELAGILEPVKEKILGVLQGNHYYQYATGVTSDQYLCELLGVPYCGPVGVFRIRLKKGTAAKNVVIHSHHSGGGGGFTLGGSVNKLLKQQMGWDADIYILGHDHRRYVIRESIMTLSDAKVPEVVERPKIFARAGAMLKTYLHESCIPKKAPHFPSYGEQAGYAPTDLGWVEIGMRLVKTPTVMRVAYDLRTPEVVC